MKRTMVLFTIMLLTASALTGCGASEKPAASTTIPAITPTPTIESSANTEKEPVALSSYFPADRITLPAESKVIEVFNDFENKEDEDSCWETTVLELDMTKTEAIAYFTPMLNDGEVDHFVVSKDTSEYIPWQIEDEYYDVVTNYVEIYASYPYPSDGVHISIIKVLLFTKDDKETIVVAWIDVNYTKSPVANTMVQ